MKQAVVQPAVAEVGITLLRFIQPNQRLRLIDVGANAGYWSENFLRLFPDTEVIALEPIPSTFAQLSQRFHGDPRVTALNHAVSPRDGPVEMWLGDDSAFASIHTYSKELSEVLGPVRSVAVSTIKLDDLQANSDDRFLILKIDVQGHEIDALSTGPTLLNSVQLAIIELPFTKQYVDRRPYVADLLSLCQKADLHPIIFHEAGQGQSPYPIEHNVVFVKSAMLSNIWGY